MFASLRPGAKRGLERGPVPAGKEAGTEFDTGMGGWVEEAAVCCLIQGLAQRGFRSEKRKPQEREGTMRPELRANLNLSSLIPLDSQEEEKQERVRVSPLNPTLKSHPDMFGPLFWNLPTRSAFFATWRGG